MKNLNARNGAPFAQILLCTPESRLRERSCSFTALFFVLASTLSFAESTCYGTSSNNKIDGAVQLPASGANLSAYSDVGITLGRTYIHTQVLDIIVAAYRELEQTLPGTKFVYGIGSDSRAKFRHYTIDFDAIGKHLYALDIAARKRKHRSGW